MKLKLLLTILLLSTTHSLQAIFEETWEKISQLESNSTELANQLNKQILTAEFIDYFVENLKNPEETKALSDGLTEIVFHVYDVMCEEKRIYQEIPKAKFAYKYLIPAIIRGLNDIKSDNRIVFIIDALKIFDRLLGEESKEDGFSIVSSHEPMFERYEMVLNDLIIPIYNKMYQINVRSSHLESKHAKRKMILMLPLEIGKFPYARTVAGLAITGWAGSSLLYIGITPETALPFPSKLRKKLQLNSKAATALKITGSILLAGSALAAAGVGAYYVYDKVKASGLQ